MTDEDSDHRGGNRTVRELGGEIRAEITHQFRDDPIDVQVKNDVIDILMGVLARHIGTVIEQDPEIPVTPLPNPFAPDEAAIKVTDSNDEQRANVSVTLDDDEALVLYDFLARAIEGEKGKRLKSVINDDAEYWALNGALCSLETILHEPFSSDYGDLVARSRSALNKANGPPED